jgi:pectin methylesterase-like acyl-CoA thioesterase
VTHPRLVVLLVLSLLAATACSRGPRPERDGESGKAGVRGNAAAINTVRAAAHAMAQPQPTVDFVAAAMEGAIKARTKSQALIQYDGYRATLTTPSDRVTQVTFQLIEAKPTILQLTAELGEPEPNPKGMLYTYEYSPTGATIRVLAEPVSMPAEEDSLVRRIVIEGARTR